MSDGWIYLSFVTIYSTLWIYTCCLWLCTLHFESILLVCKGVHGVTDLEKCPVRIPKDEAPWSLFTLQLGSTCCLPLSVLHFGYILFVSGCILNIWDLLVLLQSISHFWLILFFCGCVLNTWDLLVFASLFHAWDLFFLFVAVYSTLGICPFTLHFELVIVSRCAFYTFDLLVVCHCLVICTTWTSSCLSPWLWVWVLHFHTGMITVSLSP